MLNKISESIVVHFIPGLLHRLSRSELSAGGQNMTSLLQHLPQTGLACCFMLSYLPWLLRPSWFFQSFFLLDPCSGVLLWLCPCYVIWILFAICSLSLSFTAITLTSLWHPKCIWPLLVGTVLVIFYVGWENQRPLKTWIVLGQEIWEVLELRLESLGHHGCQWNF